MNKPWIAERSVSADEARALVTAQFPELAGAPVALLGEGWDNTAYLVGEIVFRFPRRQIAVALIEAEARVLPAIAPRLPLPIPVPRFIGVPGEAYPWPFVGHARVPGTTAAVAGLDDDQRTRCAEPVARFLAALHAIDPAPLALPPDGFGRLDPAITLPKLADRLALVERQGSHPDPSRIRRALEELARDLRPARTGTLVHGDLYSAHLLVDDRQAPAGVIDWGDVHRGDPALDLAFAPGFLPRPAHERFRRAYGEVDEPAWRLARFRALVHAVLELAYAADVGARAHQREALATLGRLLD